MKIALSIEQEDFFQRHGVLLLESLVDSAKIVTLKTQIDSLFQKSSPEVKLSKGRDLFRQNEEWKKIILARKVVEAVLELVKTKPLRLVADQLLAAGSPFSNGSLDSLFSFQGILAGALIALDDDEGEGLFPCKKGDVLLISPDKYIPFKKILSEKKGEYLLMVFAKSTAVFVRNLKDHYSSELKKMGYEFGDKLSDCYHPIVCR